MWRLLIYFVNIPLPKDPMSTFNWIFENQPIASVILTQQSRYNLAESNLLADEKVLQLRVPKRCLVIHLYYRFIVKLIIIVEYLQLHPTNHLLTFWFTFIGTKETELTNPCQIYMLSVDIHKQWLFQLYSIK